MRRPPRPSSGCPTEQQTKKRPAAVIPMALWIVAAFSCRIFFVRPGNCPCFRRRLPLRTPPRPAPQGFPAPPACAPEGITRLGRHPCAYQRPEASRAMDGALCSGQSTEFIGSLAPAQRAVFLAAGIHLLALRRAGAAPLLRRGTGELPKNGYPPLTRANLLHIITAYKISVTFPITLPGDDFPDFFPVQS